MFHNHRRIALLSLFLICAMTTIAVAAPNLPGESSDRQAPTRDGSPPATTTRPAEATSGGEAPATECDGGCFVRVAPTTAIPFAWRRDAIAYGVVDSTHLARLRETGAQPIIVKAGADALALYALSGVRNDQDRLVAAQGAVLDSIGDVRLIIAKELPFHVTALIAAGIQVEKVAPSCAVPTAGAPPPTIEANLKEITALGASEKLPLGDRQWDGPGTSAAADFLYCRFAALGYTAQYEPFIDPQGHLQFNVAALPPDRSFGPEMTLIIAHYDSLSPAGASAPGADDNASGLAAMLELAARNARDTFRAPIGFAAIAAEEPGLLGSAAYVAQSARTDTRLRAVVNLDAIGLPNDGDLLINGNVASRWIYNGLAPLAAGTFDVHWLTNPNHLSDDEEFRRAGYSAVMVTTHLFGTEPRHHTVRDIIEILDIPQIIAITDIVWRWLTQ